MRFERVSQPTAEPLTAADIQAWIPGIDATFAGAILSLARDFLEQELHRILAPSGWKVYFDRHEVMQVLRMPITPLISLTSLTARTSDGTTQVITPGSSTAYGSVIILSKATYDSIMQLDLADYDALAVEVQAGHGHASTSACPNVILLSLRELCAYWWQHRGEGFSLLRMVEQDVGAGGGTIATPPVPIWILKRLANQYHRV